MSYILKSTKLILNKGKTVNYPGIKKQFLVIHSTADVGATAANEATYFNNNWSKVEAFTQYMIDDKEAYQIYPNGQKSWGAGNVNGYSYSQIEICEFADDDRSKAAIANAVLLAKAVIAEAAAIGISLQVISHHEANQNYNGGTNHTDPDAYFARFGYTMDWFRNQLSNTPDSNHTSKGEMKMIYTFTAEGQTGSFIFDGQNTLAFAGKNAKAAYDHYTGTYKTIVGKSIPTQKKTKEQFILWNECYPVKYIDFKN